jgi:hypothetical protein
VQTHAQQQIQELEDDINTVEIPFLKEISYLSESVLMDLD